MHSQEFLARDNDFKIQIIRGKINQLEIRLKHYEDWENAMPEEYDHWHSQAVTVNQKIMKYVQVLDILLARRT